ncbi:patatin family protein, partial [Escherichia coli]|nr:patatin family protein [Escherichia coli]
RVAMPTSGVVPPLPVANETPQQAIITAPQANDPSFNNEDLA